MAKTITHEAALKILFDIVKQQGSRFKAALVLDVSPSYLGEILSNQTPISDRVAQKIGYRRVIQFEKVEAKDAQ